MSTDVAPEQISQELARILASRDFTASRQLSQFLEYAVRESLAGRASVIKERNIARKALGRDRNFNPQLDPIVRVLAGKLRKALERYYGGEGASNPIRIEIPKGGYQPTYLAPSLTLPEAVVHPNPEKQTAFPHAQQLTALPVLAVMPWVVMTNGDRERLVAEAFVQDLCVHLSRCHWIDIVNNLAATSLGRLRVSPMFAASGLRAQFCLTGATRRQGEWVRSTIQLLDARSGSLIWAYQFDLPAELLDIQGMDTATREAAAQIGDIFGVLASAVARQAKGKPLFELTACEATLKNLAYQSTLADGLFADALGSAERAVQADPEFAWGWAALALSHLDRFAVIATGETHDAADEAWICARQALKLAPTCAFAHWTVAIRHLMLGQIDEAIVTAERVVEFSQDSPFETGAAGAVLNAAGEHARGQQLIQRAWQSNPRLPGWIQWGAVMRHLGQGQYAEAHAITQQFSLPECFWDHLFTTAAAARVGDLPKARQSLRRACQLRPALQTRAREIVGRIVSIPRVRDDVLDGLHAAGLRSA